MHHQATVGVKTTMSNHGNARPTEAHAPARSSTLVIDQTPTAGKAVVRPEHVAQVSSERPIVTDRIRQLGGASLPLRELSRQLHREYSYDDLVAHLANEVAGGDRKLIETSAPVAAKLDMPAHKAAPAPATVAVSSGFRETPEHSAIFGAMMSPSVGGLVIAGAGSGKSTTLVQGAKRRSAAVPGQGMRFLVFGKANAEDLTVKLKGTGAKASTIHSMCFKAIMDSRQWNGSERINHGRVGDAAWAVAKTQVGGKEAGQAAKEMRTLWSLATATMTPLDSPRELIGMAKQYGATITPGSPAYSLLPTLDRRLSADRSSISFDEMIRDVVRDQVAIEQTPFVLVDEAQDLNRLQMRVIKMMNPAKVMAVGDPNQAIYGFRGADSTAMDTLARDFGITERFPLSVTYRCPKAVVKEAQTLVPWLQAAPGAAEGAVHRHSRARLQDTIRDTAPGDLVLARNNAPLLQAFFIRYGAGDDVNARIVMSGDEAKEYRKTMEKTAEVLKTNEAPPVAMRIIANAEEKAMKLEGAGMASAAEQIRDEAGMLSAILGRNDTVADACSMVDRMFVQTPSPDAINFTTIHRSKGLEAHKVVFLGPNLIPSKKVQAANNQALIQQEKNLSYVAITRAARELVMQEMGEGDLG